MASILIVEDERNISQVLRVHLEREGHECSIAADGEEGLGLFNLRQPSRQFDMVILDLMLPKMDGHELCKAIRRVSKVPILMLTARRDEIDKILGLELGADDYLTKPFSIRELLSRVKANLRRIGWDKSVGESESGESLDYGDLVIDSSRRTVTLDGTSVNLTPAEFDLLLTLAKKPGIVYSRTQLQELARGLNAVDSYDRSVDSLLTRIRRKLGDDPASPRFIATVRGTGYKFIGQGVSPVKAP